MHTPRIVAQDDAGRPLLLRDLHHWEKQLRLAALDEAMRLLASDKFHKVTYQEIRCIAEYGSIQIDEEVFFQTSFSTGKEVAACLAFALMLGGEEVLDDMARLRATLLDPAGSAAQTPRADPVPQQAGS